MTASTAQRNPKKRPPPAWLFTTLPNLVNKASGELITYYEMCSAFGLTREGLRKTVRRYLGNATNKVPLTDVKLGSTQMAWRVDYLTLRLDEIWKTYPNEVKKHRSR